MDHFGSSAHFVIEYSLSLSFFLSVSSSPDEVITSHGAIEADKDNVRREPYSLPQGFMWDTLELGNAEVVSKNSYSIAAFTQMASELVLSTTDRTPV